MNGARTGVLIAGAGPTGLVLACELARRGVPFRIVERRREPFDGSRGKGLQPRTLELLEDLGVLGGVLAEARTYPPMRAFRGAEVVWEGRTKELLEATPGVPYPNPVMLPQPRTEALLRARLAELGGTVEPATEVVAFRQDASGVTVSLVADGRPEQVRARYLVGADGGRSTVRAGLGVGFAGETREEQRMLVADVHAEGLDPGFWHLWSVRDDHVFQLAVCPLTAGCGYQLTRALFDGEPEPGTDLASLQSMMDEVAGRGRVRLTSVGWTSVFRPSIRMAERFRVGRVFLAGDSAHVHSPAGGQGLNTGIQDACNLGWKLAAVLRVEGIGPDGRTARAQDAGRAGPGVGVLLDSYEAERLPVAAGVLDVSTRLHDRGVRGEGDAHRRDDPVLQQLGVHYRSGPLSSERRAVPGVPTAGDRAPDAPGHDERRRPVRLFDRFAGPHTTVLGFGREGALTLAALKAEPSAERVRCLPVLTPHQSDADRPPVFSRVFVDTEGHAARAYGIPEDGPGAVFVVRPDGYLGLAADASDANAVAEYLRMLSGISEQRIP